MAKKDGASEPDPTQVAADLAVLIHNLRNVFCTPTKPNHDDPIQARYAVALGQVAEYLGRHEAGDDIARRFIELAGAMSGLCNGTVADVLRPATVGGRGPDGLVIWSYRAGVVKGLECILRSRKITTKKAAAEHIASKYTVFDRLKRNPGASLEKSILSWQRYINEGKVPASEDVQAHQHKFFEQHNYPPTEMFALGERVLAEAAEIVMRAAL
jgi:hypothetical protein